MPYLNVVDPSGDEGDRFIPGPQRQRRGDRRRAAPDDHTLVVHNLPLQILSVRSEFKILLILLY